MGRGGGGRTIETAWEEAVGVLKGNLAGKGNITRTDHSGAELFCGEEWVGGWVRYR